MDEHQLMVIVLTAAIAMVIIAGLIGTLWLHCNLLITLKALLFGVAAGACSVVIIVLIIFLAYGVITCLMPPD